jgi:hypothetical protein
VKEIALRVVGFKAVYIAVTDALGRLLDSGDGRPQSAKLFISRSEIGLSIQGLASHFGPNAQLCYVPANGQLTQAFDALYPPHAWGPKLVISGARAARAIRKLLQWQLPPRGRGSPKRQLGWDAE